jgi:hypothetical protein
MVIDWLGGDILHVGEGSFRSRLSSRFWCLSSSSSVIRTDASASESIEQTDIDEGRWSPSRLVDRRLGSFSFGEPFVV